MLTGLKRSHYYWLHCNCGVWLLWWFLTCNIWLDKGYFSAEVVHPSTHYLSFSKCIQLVTLQYIYTTVWGLHLFQLCQQVWTCFLCHKKFSTHIQEIYEHEDISFEHFIDIIDEYPRTCIDLKEISRWEKQIAPPVKEVHILLATTIRTGYGILLLSDIMKQNSGLNISIRIVCSIHTYS